MTPEEVATAVGEIAVANDTASRRAQRIAGVIRESGGHRWVGVYEVTDAEVAILGYDGPSAPAFPRFARTQGLTATALTTSAGARGTDRSVLSRPS